MLNAVNHPKKKLRFSHNYDKMLNMLLTRKSGKGSVSQFSVLSSQFSVLSSQSIGVVYSENINTTGEKQKKAQNSALYRGLCFFLFK